MRREELFKNSSGKSTKSSSKNPKPIEYFTEQEAINMIPYIKGYAKDIKRKHYSLYKISKTKKSLENLTSSNAAKREKIKELIKDLNFKFENGLKRFEEWVQELRNLKVIICSAQMGCIDIPMWDDTLQCVILLCINSESTKKRVVWHMLNENYIAARPYIVKSK